MDNIIDGDSHIMHKESNTPHNECRFIGMNVFISKWMSLYRSDVVIPNELHVRSATMLTSTARMMLMVEMTMSGALVMMLLLCM